MSYGKLKTQAGAILLRPETFCAAVRQRRPNRVSPPMTLALPECLHAARGPPAQRQRML
jgi:hypothetical protein